MGGGGSQEVKYVGPTKEELAQKQAEYDKQIQVLQEQNRGVQSQYDLMRQDSEKALAERTSLMQQELERTRQSYDEVIGTTRKALEDSQAAQASQASLMSGLTEKQEQASRIQSAEAEKSTIMARDAMSNTKRTVDAAKQQVSSRRRRRGLMSTMSTMNR